MDAVACDYILVNNNEECESDCFLEVEAPSLQEDENGYYRMITRTSIKEIKGNKIIRGKEEVSDQCYEMGTKDDHLYSFDVTHSAKGEMKIYFRKITVGG